MKRELSFHRDLFFQLLLKRIDLWIDEEEKSRFKENNAIRIDLLDEDEYKLDEDGYFDVRSDIIKAVFAANNDFTKYLKDNFQAELSYRKNDLFPRKWMLDDRQIKNAIDRCSRFLPIMNALHNRNRDSRGEELKVMKAEADKIIGKRRIDILKKEAAYISYFVGNAHFYADLKGRTDIPINTIKKYIQAFVKIGIIKKIHDGGSKGTLYADGWFQQMPDNKLRKFPFLIKTTEIMKGLRRLPALINSNN
ncbi:MAG: hypothetical protein M0Q01_04585 [Syntrophales bacterium]|jgi:hypothetical protein|nr:hypothetical protein [Syntrophales bacterium]